MRWTAIHCGPARPVSPTLRSAAQFPVGAGSGLQLIELISIPCKTPPWQAGTRSALASGPPRLSRSPFGRGPLLSHQRHPGSGGFGRPSSSELHVSGPVVRSGGLVRCPSHEPLSRGRVPWQGPGRGRGDPYEGWFPAIVHEIDVPCQLDRARFTPVRASRASRVTKFAHPVCPVHGINHEDSLGCSVTRPTVRRTYSKGETPVLLTASAAAVPRNCVPGGGTRSEVSARPAGATEVLATSRTLSTGGLRKAAQMISTSFVRVGR